MKKVLFTLVFCLTFVSMFAQSTKKSQLLRYVTTAPDGSVTFTVTDDSRKDFMQLESVEDFYKYQLRDAITDKLIITSANKGKVGTIDKSKLIAGNYNLVVYTKSFIITSEITVGSPILFENNVAINNEN